MQLQAVIKTYIYEDFLYYEQATIALSEFFKSIPDKILRLCVDSNIPSKKVYKDDNKIYNYAVNPVLKTALLEVYEHSAQTVPTMGLFLDKSAQKINLIGTKAGKQFSMKFFMKDGVVSGNMKINE